MIEVHMVCYNQAKDEITSIKNYGHIMKLNQHLSKQRREARNYKHS